MTLPVLVAALSLANPTPEVTLQQAAARHRIGIGAAVDPRYLEEADYAAVLKAEFSVVEPENATKFGPIHPRPGNDPASYDFAGADRIAEFAKANRKKMRGHTLVWHNQNPGWLPGSSNPEELSRTLEQHIQTVVRRYAGRIYAWDVVNEAFGDNGSMRSSIWYDKPGIGFAGKGTAYIEAALKMARKADPKARLFYNDYGAETLGAKADAIYAMAKDFKARRVPLDGIGFQCHFIMEMNKPDVLDSIEKNFDRFAKLGLDIEVTELDIRVKNNSPATLREQADFYGKFVALCARQPRCRLIQTWGVTDKYSWIPGTFRGTGWALLWDEHYGKKPAHAAVIEALMGKR